LLFYTINASQKKNITEEMVVRPDLAANRPWKPTLLKRFPRDPKHDMILSGKETVGGILAG
jgi:hypothetical protein